MEQDNVMSPLQPLHRGKSGFCGNLCSCSFLLLQMDAHFSPLQAVCLIHPKFQQIAAISHSVEPRRGEKLQYFDTWIERWNWEEKKKSAQPQFLVFCKVLWYFWFSAGMLESKSKGFLQYFLLFYDEIWLKITTKITFVNTFPLFVSLFYFMLIYHSFIYF